jgi:hypothetical protein
MSRRDNIVGFCLRLVTIHAVLARIGEKLRLFVDA